MIINPSFPSGHVIFCDDIRYEVTGKTSLIGVYGHDMTIATAGPVVIPQLCAVISFRFAPQKEVYRPVFKVMLDERDEPLFTSEVEVQPFEVEVGIDVTADADVVRFLQVDIRAEMQNVALSKNGNIKVRAYIGDDEVRLGQLRIVLIPPV